MSLADDLRAAKALIDTPEKWTKGVSEELRDGVNCYCAAGAIWHALDGYSDDRSYDRAMRAEAALGEQTASWVRTFNDSPDTTHADIMALFDRAIADAERSGP